MQQPHLHVLLQNIMPKANRVLSFRRGLRVCGTLTCTSCASSRPENAWSSARRTGRQWRAEGDVAMVGAAALGCSTWGKVRQGMVHQLSINTLLTH